MSTKIARASEELVKHQQDLQDQYNQQKQRVSDLEQTLSDLSKK